MADSLARMPRLPLLLAATMALLPFSSSPSRALADREITIGVGDSLTAIALTYFGDAAFAQQIAEYNHITDPDSVVPGQTLMLPDAPLARTAGTASAPDAGTAPAVVRDQAAPRAGPVIQTGVATWYGPGFEGNRTKCGQVFHETDLTASSNDLPCGTIIQVTNVQNGRSIVVTVDDTGGFQHPTILDLSGAAFRALAPADTGVVQVSVARVAAVG